MSRFVKIVMPPLIFILLGLSACSGGAPAATPTSSDLLYTQLAQTVAVQLAQTVSAQGTQTAAAVPPTSTVTNTLLADSTEKATRTPLLSATPLPGQASATPAVALATQRPVVQASCDNFTFSDVNYPDGSDVPGGSVFVKTWEFKNTGPCTWNQNYRLIFGWKTDGSDWDQTGPVNLPSVVNVGDVIDLSVTLTAPTKPGGYAAWFRLQNDKGYNFGPIFAVSILVK